ncbi:CpsD/CapB family tyrosine-protein kinase [Metabacillus sp. GX 13764]|uniref:CpsD/CapB family tyrosine-protein kinase n=1 Tax=Metabacillus kandeliae TaxID=2900151 RepID=UPI001E5CD7F9|nr:CpsD/CapB family tyrosine-protein kinase [Metabacillus kandeliae]MCD7033135.1 CpsD/CapB family tyrosine-protein kinase [Metabacillus kandeliae]
MMSLFDKKLSPRNLYAYMNAGSALSEQYRTVRTNLLFALDKHKRYSLAVTSPEKGDGKSVTCTNLAISLAQQGCKVLLIDADMRNPSLHTLFNVKNTTGLSNVLNKTCRIEEAIQNTPVGRLDLLPSGPLPYNPTELADSQAMENLISLALEEYNLVLFDTPAINQYSDAKILANQCDQLIMVIKSGKTAAEKAVKAKKSLSEAKAEFLGIILNQR